MCNRSSDLATYVSHHRRESAVYCTHTHTQTAVSFQLSGGFTTHSHTLRHAKAPSVSPKRDRSVCVCVCVCVSVCASDSQRKKNQWISWCVLQLTCFREIVCTSLQGDLPALF